MLNKQIKEIIKNADFGSIDGLDDSLSYFVDDDFWNRIILNPQIFFVSGRKGTGKSAVYSALERQSMENGVHVLNLSVNDLNMERLLALPGKEEILDYTQIWQNLVLIEISKYIVKYGDGTEHTNEFKELNRWVESIYGKELKKLSKAVINEATKVGGSVNIPLAKELELKVEGGKEKTYSTSINISLVNERFSELLEVLLSSAKNQVIIQLDQIDEHFAQGIDYVSYLRSISQLLSFCYYFNLNLKKRSVTSKFIVYIREDILDAISPYSSLASKFAPHTYVLDWTIKKRADWDNNPFLLRMINKRLFHGNEEFFESEKECFDKVFDSSLKLKEPSNRGYARPFQYIVHRSFHRPRDIVMFMIKLKHRVETSDDFSKDIFLASETEYCQWLYYTDLVSEIAPFFPKQLTSLEEFLHSIGNNIKSEKQLYENFIESFGDEDKGQFHKLLYRLFDLGIIDNMEVMSSGRKRRHSKLRDSKKKYRREYGSILHSGIAKALC
jgi:hypothetical protein